MHVLNILLLLYMESCTVCGTMMVVLVQFIEFRQGILDLVINLGAFSHTQENKSVQH